MPEKQIRNFCIIAHVDHGKTTLTDRILQFCNAVPQHKFQDQFMDSHKIERDRGITIKAKPIRFFHQGVMLNLIDTPGHVDFTYEVSRALAACEGAVLVVDASQGIQAQTITNFNSAKESNLTIIPIVNKIDLQNARVQETVDEVAHIVGCRPGDVLKVSAKQGIGISELINEIILRVPPPVPDTGNPLRALVYNARYDEFRGVVAFLRVFEGDIRKGQKLRAMATGFDFEVEEVGVFTPDLFPVEQLSAGEVGYVCGNIRDVKKVKVGDTLTDASKPARDPLPGYREPKPVVFCGFYPPDGEDYNVLEKSLARMTLNDPAFTYHPVSSELLGLGFQCGFLGLLHMEIVEQRLEIEFGVNIVRTVPMVTYRITVRAKGGYKTIEVNDPAKIPDHGDIVEWCEPYVRVKILTPPEFLGNVLRLCEGCRPEFIEHNFLTSNRALVNADLPFAEIDYDFFDRLKSVSQGYASMDYSLIGYFPSELVKATVLVNQKPIEPLSFVAHKDRAQGLARVVLSKLRKEIPRHMFDIVLQASVKGKVVAREEIKAIAKKVTAKCYGGDFTRKAKLIQKVKEGKKKMKSVGRVEIPQSAFLAVLSAKKENQ